MIRRRELRLLALCAAACASPAAAHHTEPVMWRNPLGGSFDDVSNWTMPFVPAEHDSVYFELPNRTFTTTFPSSILNVQLIVGGNDVTFDLLGNSYTLYDLAGIDVSYAPMPATLRIRNGAVVSNIGASVGRTASSIGNVFIDGPTAALNVAEDLQAGQRGNATIAISNGAKLSNRNGYMASESGSKSRVDISGEGSRWDNAELHVGWLFNSSADLHIAGGTVSATSFIRILRTGRIFYEGGQIETPQLEIEGGTLFGFGAFTPKLINGGGSIEVPSGQQLLLSGNLLSPNGGSLTKKGAGELVISGSQEHAPFTGLGVGEGKLVLSSNAGAAATASTPAFANLWLSVDSAAAITLGADQDLAHLSVYEFADGQQAFDLASPAETGAFRSVRVADVTSKAEVWASIANANRVGAADPHDGIFDSGLAAHPNAAIGFATVLDAHGDWSLLVRPTRIGDLNLDGVVTIADFIDLAANFGGTEATWQEGDLNYDGAVTISDFIDAAANFGSAYAMAPQTTAVPEPSALLLIVPLAMLRRRRK